MKFNESSVEYLEYIQATRSAGTYQYQLSKVSMLVRYFNDKDNHTFNNKSVVGFITFMRKRNPQVSATTLNKYIGILKRIIKYSSNIVMEFEKLPEVEKIIEVLDQETIDLVFHHLQKKFRYKESFRNYTMFKVLYDTGLRINETLHLRIRDIDFDTNTIHVKIAKTRRDRYVFFTDSTKKVIKRLITTHHLNDYLFINYQKNKRLSVDNVQNICYRLELRLDLKQKIRPHRWRHTFATRYLKRGGDLESLRLILGHSTLKTTQKYLHLDKDFLHTEYFKVNDIN